MTQPVWLEEIVASYDQDDKAIELLQQLSIDPESKHNFQLRNGLLRYKTCIWMGNQSNLDQKIFAAFHSSPLGGHSSFPVTYKRIHSLFRWTGMKNFIKHQVQSYVVCQQANPERVNYPRLLSPLPFLGRLGTL